MKKSMDMCSGPLASKILLFTVPVMLTNLLQLFYNTADIVVLGHMGSNLSVGAVGATSTVITLIVNTFMGLSVGVNVAAAQAIGAKNLKEARNTVQTSALLGLICGLLATLVGLIASPAILGMMKTPERTLPLAILYIRVYFLGAPANLLYNFLAGLLRAKGETKFPLYVLAGSGALKLLLTALFTGLLKLDAAGAAAATVVSQYASAAVMVVFLMKRDDEIKLTVKNIKLNGKKAWEIIKIGVPSGIQGSVFALSAMVIQSAVNSFGDTFITGNTAAGSIDSISYAFHNAFSYTVISFVAQNKGAGNYGRIKKSVAYCLMMGAAAAIITGGLVVLFSHSLMELYIPRKEEAISYGIIRLKYLCIPYFLLAAMDVMSGALRGLGSALPPALISLAGACGLRILWIYTVFERFKTPETLYLSFPVTWGMTFLALLVYYVILLRKNEKISVGFDKDQKKA